MATSAPSIEELTVSVRVARVGSRQMSQAFYHQIPTRLPLRVTEEGSVCLDGKIWGSISCSVEKHNGYGGEHCHILWEQDGSLYRAVLYAKLEAGLKRDWGIYDFEKQQWECVIRAAKHAILIGTHWDSSTPGIALTHGEVSLKGHIFNLDSLSEDARKLLEYPNKVKEIEEREQSAPEYFQRQRQKLDQEKQEAAAKVLASLGITTTSTVAEHKQRCEELLNQATDLEQKALHLLNTFKDCYLTVQAAPMLYISAG